MKKIINSILSVLIFVGFSILLIYNFTINSKAEDSNTSTITDVVLYQQETADLNNIRYVTEISGVLYEDIEGYDITLSLYNPDGSLFASNTKHYSDIYNIVNGINTTVDDYTNYSVFTLLEMNNSTFTGKRLEAKMKIYDNNSNFFETKNRYYEIGAKYSIENLLVVYNSINNNYSVRFKPLDNVSLSDYVIEYRSIDSQKLITYENASFTLADNYVNSSISNLTPGTYYVRVSTVVDGIKNISDEHYINTYHKIDFEVNGGSSINSKYREYGKTLSAFADPVKEGYSFKGWYLDSNLTNEFDFNTIITSDLTLYAKWQKDIDLIPYIDNLISETKSSTGGYIPAWNGENFKDKWNYIDGVFLNSIVNLNAQEDDNDYIDFVVEYVNKYINSDGIFVKPKSKPNSTTNEGFTTGELDAICESKILFDLYEYTNDERYKTAIEYTYSSLVNKVNKCSGNNSPNFNHKNTYSNQIWLDGMYMYVPFYARYALYTSDATLRTSIFNEIKSQYKYIRDNMYDEQMKLYHHGHDTKKSVSWADSTTGNSSSYWLRSMGWYIVSLVDVLDYYPEGENRTYLINLLNEAINGLYQYQDSASKMFYQVIHLGNVELEVSDTYISGSSTTRYRVDSETGKKYISNYLEASGSSMIAYTSMKAASNGYIANSYLEKGIEVFEGIYNHSYSEENGKRNLNDICVQAGLVNGSDWKNGTDLYYLCEKVGSNDAKGVGPFIMAFLQYRLAKTPKTTYTISFESNGGSSVDSINGVYKIPSSLSTPTKEGYSFAGWYKDSELKNACSSKEIISSNITLYAKWTEASKSKASKVLLNQDFSSSVSFAKTTNIENESNSGYYYRITDGTTDIDATATNYIDTSNGYARLVDSTDYSTYAYYKYQSVGEVYKLEYSVDITLESENTKWSVVTFVNNDYRIAFRTNESKYLQCEITTSSGTTYVDILSSAVVKNTVYSIKVTIDYETGATYASINNTEVKILTKAISEFKHVEFVTTKKGGRNYKFDNLKVIALVDED